MDDAAEKWNQNACGEICRHFFITGVRGSVWYQEERHGTITKRQKLCLDDSD